MAETTSLQPTQELAKTIDTAVKFVGDFAVLPGASQLLKGQLGSGIGHAAAGFVGGALLGPVGWVLVAANSFTRSICDKHVWQLVGQQSSEQLAKMKDSQADHFAAELKEARETEPSKRTPYQNRLVSLLPAS